MIINKYKVGFRAIKTTVAVAICIVLSLVLRRHDKFFASIAAIICMRKTNLETSAAGFGRLIGTIIGGVIGLLVLLITQIFPHKELINLLLSPLCVLLVIYICNVFGRKSSVEIGTIVILSILMSHSETAYTNTFMYVINRVLDTSMGVLVAMFVNKFMFRKAVSTTT